MPLILLTNIEFFCSFFDYVGQANYYFLIPSLFSNASTVGALPLNRL